MSATEQRRALDVEAVRARFPALASGWAYFDGPGGTQAPETVIEAMDSYLRSSNANLGGAFAASVESDAVEAGARAAAARFLGAPSVEEVGFGANMTTINLILTRVLGRELRAGDEVLVTALDHDANISPWLHLERDLGIVVRQVDTDEQCRLRLDDLEAKLSDRTRVVAFPWASNAVGTVNDVPRLAALAHEAGALAWVDAVHYAPHGPIDVAAAGVDVLLCSPYKFFGPHLGLFYARTELLERWRSYKVRPAADRPLAHRHEPGTQSHEALAGLIACLAYLEETGWPAIRAWEGELCALLLEGLQALAPKVRLFGIPSTEGRVPTFCFTVAGSTPRGVCEALARERIAAWDGDYYALAIMERLGLERQGGAVRVGAVHYTSRDDVERLLAALAAL